MFKKWDFIIIAILMLLSFVPEIVFTVVVGRDYNSTYAEITIAGELQKTIPLTDHSGEEIIEFKSKYGTNIVKINDDNIGIIDATCHDHICMNPEYIKNPGQSLVCLPNKFMIEIKGQKSNDDEEIIISH